MLLRLKLVYLRVRDSVTFYEKYNGKFYSTGYVMPKDGYMCVKVSPEPIDWDNKHIRLALKGSSLDNMFKPKKDIYINLQELTSDKVEIVSPHIKNDIKGTVSEYIEDSLNRMYQVKVKITEFERRLYKFNSDGIYNKKENYLNSSREPF